MLLRFISPLLLLLILSCNTSRTTEFPLLDYVPEEASLVIKINNLNAFLSELKNNQFLTDIAKKEAVEKVTAVFSTINLIESDTTGLLALVENDSTHILFITHTRQADSILRDSTMGIKPAISANDSENKKLHSLTRNGILLLSTSESLLKRLSEGKPNIGSNHPLNELYKTASADKSASIFINSNTPPELFLSFLTTTEPKATTPENNWTTFDFNSTQRYLRLNGLTRVKDSADNLLRLFKGTHPIRNISPSIASESADAVLSFTFDDFETFSRNQNSYLESPYAINTKLHSVEEVGIIYQKNNKAILLSTFNSEGIQSYLDVIALQNSDYQGNDIIRLSKKDFLVKSFAPLIEDFDANFYTIIDNRYIFAENSSLLESLIRNFNNGTIFRTSALYQSVEEGLTEEATVLFVANAKGLQLAASSLLSADLLGIIKKTNTNKYGFSAQAIADTDFFHSHLSVSSLGGVKKSGTTTPLFSVLLDNEIITEPQFVLNHRSGKKEIAVQDADHNLYLISTEGKVLWKKKLEGGINGKISQVDLYKNGRLQLAFTTANQFLILDRNGKEVAPFVKSYPGGNLNPLAVFDYENNRDYRFVVTQGTKVHMYNSKGNVVTGFTYTESESPILEAPKHIRNGNRDYLVFKLENGRLKILNRIGKDRVVADREFQFSTNPVYLYRNKFVLTDKGGVLYSIDTKGNTEQSPLNMNEDHGLVATTKTLVTLNENALTIKGRNRDLELGVYLPPKIFYIYDKIYISTTDIQSGQVYLFDSRNEPVSNFPVFGNSTIDLGDMDNDGHLELVTKDQDNSLIVYSIH